MDEDSPPRDHVAPDDDSVERHVKSKSTWLRLFFMLVVVLLYSVSRVVVSAVVIIQFFWMLFTGKTNDDLRKLGQSLAMYSYQIIRYLTFNTDERPFPFDQQWPSSEPPDFRAQ